MAPSKPRVLLLGHCLSGYWALAFRTLALTALAGATPEQRREWGASSSEMACSYGPDRWADTLLSAVR
jgi:hypothetical protein